MRKDGQTVDPLSCTIFYLWALEMRNERKVADICRVEFIALSINSFNLKLSAILFSMLICQMFDPHNQPMADKRDSVPNLRF